jgi:hypothetical protein
MQGEKTMTHRFPIGITVFFESGFPNTNARGAYKIVKQLPVERDNRIIYRIKSSAETFERTAEENQLRRE